ncbi:MAG: ATP-binding cassette domain-containing protein [Nocardioides sp.]
MPNASRTPQAGDGTTLSLTDVVKTYVMGADTVQALRGVSLEIRRNEYVAVMGPSGSGKSTLMNVIGCLDVPTSGTYSLEGQMVANLSEYAAGRHPQPAHRLRLPDLQPASRGRTSSTTSSCR